MAVQGFYDLALAEPDCTGHGGNGTRRMYGASNWPMGMSKKYNCDYPEYVTVRVADSQVPSMNGAK